MTSAEWSDGAGSLLSLFDEMTDPGAKWVSLAVCAQVDLDLHFPEKGRTDQVRIAKAICAECPVREECLEFALDFEDRTYGSYGVFGGKTARERDEIRRQRHAPRSAA